MRSLHAWMNCKRAGVNNKQQYHTPKKNSVVLSRPHPRCAPPKQCFHLCRIAGVCVRQRISMEMLRRVRTNITSPTPLSPHTRTHIYHVLQYKQEYLSINVLAPCLLSKHAVPDIARNASVNCICVCMRGTFMLSCRWWRRHHPPPARKAVARSGVNKAPSKTHCMLECAYCAFSQTAMHSIAAVRLT